MALKRLKVKMAAASAIKPGDIPVISIEGEIIKQYNTADQQVKDGEKLMKDLRGEILEVGVDAQIYPRNVADPLHPTASVKLQDEAGEVLLVSFVNKYSIVPDVDAAGEFFADAKDGSGKKVDINDYMQETVVGKFDCNVFLDHEGRFQQRVYDRFRKALEAVAAELGVACPLDTKKVVQPLPCFHEKRWAIFPDPDKQKRLSELCPNTMAIKPVRPKDGTR